MKNILFFTLLVIFASCTTDPSKSVFDCEPLNWEGMLEAQCLDPFYALMLEEFSMDQLNSCECEDLLAMQDFTNEVLPTLNENYMPQNKSCEQIQEQCIPLKEMPVQATEYLSQQLEGNLISEGEFEIMDQFFTEFFDETVIPDFDAYRCMISETDKEGVLQSNYAGMLSTATINLFDSEYIIYQGNDLNVGSTLKIHPVISWLVRNAWFKYCDAMGVAWIERYNTCDSCFAEAVFDELAD